jgi:hypothetical protein
MHMTKPVVLLLFAAALLGSAGAYADFQQAMQDYNAGRYDAAHGEFLALAELGDCSSQFNLGAMALKGQGGPRDSASGAGWLQAAAGNGCEQLVNKRLAALSAGLSSADASTAAAIVGRYGHEALRVQGVFDPDFSCADTLAPRVLSAPEPDYPQQPAGQRQQALVITALTIGADGFARDPEVLLAVPEQRFAAAAIEAWLNSRFAPAMRNGHPVAYRLQTKQVFAVQGAGPLAQLEPLQQARSAAAAGDTQGEYLLGLAATFESSLGLTSARASGMLLSAARAGGPQAQYWVGSQLRATAECHPRADGAIWLTHAAAGGDAAAQVLLASELLRGTPAATTCASTWLRCSPHRRWMRYVIRTPRSLWRSSCRAVRFSPTRRCSQRSPPLTRAREISTPRWRSSSVRSRRPSTSAGTRAHSTPSWPPTVPGGRGAATCSPRPSEAAGALHRPGEMGTRAGHRSARR